MPYEMFLTIQLMHLTCRKYCVPFPTKEGWDLFQRTSDNSSRNNPKWRIIWQEFRRTQEHSSYVTLLSDIIDAESLKYEEVAKKKGKESTGSRRIMHRMQYRKSEGKFIVSTIWICKIKHAVYGNIMGYKEIFVARRFSWKAGIDYEEAFAATRI